MEILERGGVDVRFFHRTPQFIEGPIPSADDPGIYKYGQTQSIIVLNMNGDPVLLRGHRVVRAAFEDDDNGFRPFLVQVLFRLDLPCRRELALGQRDRADSVCVCDTIVVDAIAGGATDSIVHQQVAAGIAASDLKFSTVARLCSQRIDHRNAYCGVNIPIVFVSRKERR